MAESSSTHAIRTTWVLLLIRGSREECHQGQSVPLCRSTNLDTYFFNKSPSPPAYSPPSLSPPTTNTLPRHPPSTPPNQNARPPQPDKRQSLETSAPFPSHKH